MKKIISLLLVLLMLGSLSFYAFATGTSPQLVERADLISDEEEAELLTELERVSDACTVQISVVTLPAISDDIATVTEQFYDDGSYGFGSDRAGAMLLVSMNPREYYVFCNGLAWEAIDPDEVCDAIYSDMAGGDYADAFLGFARECESYLDAYINGESSAAHPVNGEWDEDGSSDESFDLGSNLLIALVSGVVIALIYVLVLKGQLKSVGRQYAASSYVRPGSMHLTQSGDYFMYRNVTRTPKPKNNSSSSSFGGGGSSSRGGSGRSF